MKKLLINCIVLLVLIVAVSCKKNDAPDLSNEKSYIIHGKILNDTINWKIIPTTMQPVGIGRGRSSVEGYSNLKKSYFIYFHVEDKSTPILQLTVSSPAYNMYDSLHSKQAFFTTGLHKFNMKKISELSGFKVDLRYNDQNYSTTYGEQDSSTFEILTVEYVQADKIEDFILARTNIKLNCNMYDVDGKYVGKVKDLVFNAEFQLDKEK